HADRIRAARAPLHERRQADVHRADHRPRLAFRPEHDGRHGARAHELLAQKDRAESLRAALHRDRTVGRLSIHCRTRMTSFALLNDRRRPPVLYWTWPGALDWSSSSG